MVIYLVRDPRGVLESRWRMPWCTSNDCIRPEVFCSDLIEDWKAAQEMLSQFPRRLKHGIIEFNVENSNVIELMR